jgi:DNA-directed RNA polymerase subunit omega
VPSKYTLVHLAARRAREVNAYYHSLGEGLGRYTPPLVDQVASNKPLSIALEEIAAEKIVVRTATDARRAAEELRGAGAAGEGEGEDAAILSLGAEGDEERVDEGAAVTGDADVDPAAAGAVASEEPSEPADPDESS